MHVAFAQVDLKVFPLCRIEADNSLVGLARLKELLWVNGIKAEFYLGDMLKLNHTVFWVQEVGGEDDLERTLQAVQKADSETKVEIRP